MECNKDDAIKAREIAERKFNAKDIAGAKKFAIKARKLYPGLEGISQMLATLDVYAAAENLVLGEADFYGVLGVGPQADDDTIRKQYRKLALMLHPDKNKSIGAEGAFKLISEAWSMLSDKNKKAAYDVKRNSSGFAQKANPSSVPHPSSMPTGSNGFYNFAKSTKSNPKVNKKTSHRNDSASSEANQNTFWTVCNGCKMQYEYLRSYRNQRLQCPNCLKPFFALETPPPAANHSTKPWVGGFTSGKNSQQEARIKKSNNDGYNTSSFEWTPFSGGAGVSSVAQAANVVQQTYEKVKRVREEAQAAKKLEKAMKRKRHAPDNTISSLNDKKRKVGDDASMNNNQMGRGRTVFGKSSTNSPLKPCDAGSIYASRINKLNSMKELSQSELRSILMHKARKEISSKIVEWKSVSMIGNAGQEKTKEYYNKDGRQEKAAINGNSSREYSNSAHSVSQSNEIVERLSIPVPDSVFYDFDKDRTEKTFGENQVWAVYDYDDGMPRFYAMVRCVISQNPFKLRIGWLNSYSENVKLGGFSNTCGDFKVGRHETNDALNCFSHKVWWTQGPWGAIRIFPRKGDVWALYRNWSPEWNELTEDTVIHKYDLVEVLGSYDEELGVVVIPLVKVAGFKTVFHHHVDPKQVRRIPIEEIARFSYQVPSHLILGHEASNAPKGCRELDPAALPPEFLQMIADAKEDDIGENLKISEVSDSKASDKGFQGAAKSNEVIPSESQSAV